MIMSNSQVVLVLCVVALAGIAALTDYRVEISGGTFKFEKNIQLMEGHAVPPPVQKNR